MEALALDQHRNDHRGRGHRQRRADRSRRGAAWPSRRRSRPDERRHDDLRDSQSEHQMAHASSRSNDRSSPIVNNSATTPNAAMRSIASTLVSASASSHGARAARRAESGRPQRDAGEQIAKHGAYPQPKEQRRDHPCRHQEQQRLLVDRKVDGSFTRGSVAGVAFAKARA